MRIKEGNEWKVVFTTLEGSFEPTVMFFGLTNSLVTFQVMMNELLRDLISIEKVAAFIDDIIVGIEMEEGHDKIVAEVIKRLEENNLYVKPEKYKWKVREIGFLEVVIGPEGIKIVSQIRYSLVVILELNSVSEVQYKDVMMIDDGKYQ